jgi:predicted CxxxxCH...CXXCH cytochrome family protein
MKRQYQILFIPILSLAVLLISCSDLKKDLPTGTSTGTKIHEAGWNDTTSASFHGRLVKQSGYDFSQCTYCHSQQFTGGTSGIKCFTCHASYPHKSAWASELSATYHGKYLQGINFDLTECKRCHGAAFTGGTSGESCYGCHTQYPHVAGWTTVANTGFHGNAIQNLGWKMDNCKVCHGTDYRGGSSRSSCYTCHNKAGGPENCTVCHGGTNAAPPQDLAGHTSASFAGVGTHQSHIMGVDTLGLTACNECHAVPSSLGAIGHIDNTAGSEVVFAGSVVTSPFAAFAGSAAPSYSHTTLRCDNTYCHGYFPNGNRQSPLWNDTTGQFHACGSCHGDVTKSTIADKSLPKTSINGGTHPNDNRCYNCHPNVINTSYKFIGSKHLNGKLDF